MHLHRLERSYVVKSLFREKAKSEVYHSEMNLVKRNIPWGNNTKTKLYTIKRIYTKYLQRNRLKKLSPPRNLLSVIKNSLTWKIGEETQYIYIRHPGLSGSDNTSMTKGAREKERGRDEEQDYRANREAVSSVSLRAATSCLRTIYTPLHRPILPHCWNKVFSIYYALDFLSRFLPTCDLVKG